MDRPRRQRKRGRSRRGGEKGRPGEPRESGYERSNGQTLRQQPLPELLDMTPFSVFCALHLGITATDGYDPLDERGVARRFGVTETELADFLEARGLTCGALQRADFDLSSARLDIEVAPEGISRVELARTLFDELREAAGRDDWEAPAQDES